MTQKLNTDNGLQGRWAEGQLVTLTAVLQKIGFRTIGNIDLLKLSKTTFLCSRKIPPSLVLKYDDWAMEQRESK